MACAFVWVIHAPPQLFELPKQQGEAMSGEIRSKKILVKEIFSNMWFSVPNYQRPYIWSSDEINDLMDDLKFAQSKKPKSEYFLGSFVFQSRAIDHPG